MKSHMLFFWGMLRYINDTKPHIIYLYLLSMAGLVYCIYTNVFITIIMMVVAASSNYINASLKALKCDKDFIEKMSRYFTLS